jgi:energy-coupling factor transport system ATP-binding protein
LTSFLIDIRHLSFTYRGADRPALQEISYRHAPGEFTAVMGPTGAGKSTFCRCLNGLIPSFIKGTLTGDMALDGERLTRRHVYEIARRIGLVFQDFEAQLFSTNVELEVAFALENFAVPREDMNARVREALGRVGLEGFETRDPSTLSGGEKQRLAIASVLAGKPSVVVMDEPTTDLDPLGKRDIFALARALRHEIQGIVLVEHETEHILNADRVLLMSEGRVVREGPPREILSDPDLLERLGVRPLQTTVLLKTLGLVPTALSVEEAVRAVHAAGWRAHPAAAGRSTAGGTPVVGDPVIEVDALSHRYGAGPAAVDNVSLVIRRGEFVAVIGQNGCGKTTLAKHFNGLYRPTDGTVRVLGRGTGAWSLPELGRRVGYVFQNPDHQIFANTVREEVGFGPRNYGLPPDEIDGRVRRALDVVGLAGREDQDPFSLTKGERQQLALASVLATDPEILILDEPTTGLDYHGQRAILDLIRQFNASGRTVVMITHSMWVVAEYASRCLIMHRGRIVQDSDVYACFRDPGLLETLSLEAPEAVRIGRGLGIAAKSVDDILACLKRDQVVK